MNAALAPLASPQPSSQPLLIVDDVSMFFPVRTGILRRTTGWVRAVDGVSFELARGQTLGLVGESGCGKSTLGRALVQLYRPTSGHVRLDGTELTTLKGGQLQRARRRIQMVFQDPYSSLNPRMTIGAILSEPLEIHGLATDRRRERVKELLALVHLGQSQANRYPHELSGGQRQRVGIARAIAVEPELLVCDEAVSALDVSIRGQIVNLLEELQQRLGIAYIFISHELGIVRHISTDVAVMYLGKIVELANRDSLYEEPLHPYTRALLSAIPVPDPRIQRRSRRQILVGEVPSPSNPPSGCRFRTRCPYAQEICTTMEPPLVEVLPNHRVACHFAKDFIGRSIDAVPTAANGGPAVGVTE